MHQLSEYLLSKKLNKAKEEFSEKYCIYVPTGSAFFYFEQHFKDRVIDKGVGPILFVAKEDEIPERFGQNNKNNHLDKFTIPNKYTSFEELKDDFLRNRIGLGDLEEQIIGN